MANNNKLVLISSCFAILLAVATATIANGVPYKGVNVVGFRVRGRAVCSLSPNPPITAPGIAGVDVRITCNGGTTVLSHALTNPDGTFDALVTNLDGLSFDQSTVLPCFASIQLPAGLSCTVFPPKATIRATVSLVGTITQDLVGLVADALTSAFSLLRA